MGDSFVALRNVADGADNDHLEDTASRMKNWNAFYTLIMRLISQARDTGTRPILMPNRRFFDKKLDKPEIKWRLGEVTNSGVGALRLWLQIFLAVTLMVFASTGAQCQTLYSFETAEDFLAPAASWPAWQDTLDRHFFEREAIHQCLSDEEACPPRLRALRHVLLRGADLTFEQQIRLVNRYINKQRYKDDRVSSKSVAGNQWETLTEFLHRGGDCEDFAVAKYFVLREFGVDAMDMRIVIGREAQRATHHAMLAIKFDDDVWLLENDNTIHKNGYQDIKEFVYALNEQGIWDHERRD